MPRHVIIAASLPAPPEQLYDMYVDAQVARGVYWRTGGDSATGRAPFSAFGGALSGTVLHVEPKRLVVQRWRSRNWPEDAVDSVLTMTFWPEAGGGRIELVHANVPEEDFAGVSQGWEKYYWTPWRNYLQRRSGDGSA